MASILVGVLSRLQVKGFGAFWIFCPRPNGADKGLVTQTVNPPLLSFLERGLCARKVLRRISGDYDVGLSQDMALQQHWHISCWKH